MKKIIAEYLRIDEAKIVEAPSNEEKGKVFEISDEKIKKIDIKIWEQNFSLEFDRCSFEENIVFPSTIQAIQTKLKFQDCVFHAFINARRATFNQELICSACNFKEKVDFSGAKFQRKVSFLASHFENEARFIEAKFLAQASNNETYENNFREARFERSADFSSVEFKGKVTFSISRFAGEARFVQAKFLAQASNNETYENNFREAQFGGKASFDSAEFQGKIDFGISCFAGEARFIKTKFSAQALNNETYENNFREARFERNASFDSAEFQGKVTFSISRFAGEARFIKTKFLAQASNNETYENNFREAQFGGKASFDSAEFTGKVDFRVSRFVGEARFIQAKFLAQTSNDKVYENNFGETQFGGQVFFSRVGFVGKIAFVEAEFCGGGNFINTEIKSKIFFWKNIFQDFMFKDVAFTQEVRFHKCIFRNTLFVKEKESIIKEKEPSGGKLEAMFAKSVEFKHCVFKETNTFGDNVFPKSSNPILLHNTFEGQFNIDHNFLQYEFEALKLKNKELQSQKDKEGNDVENDISSWRDLFRRLKSNRLAHHNLIDASELRKQELYAREIELEDKKSPLFSKDWIEKWQLCFYRHTSDHHTDLLKIFNNVILLIALFGVYACAMIGIKSDAISTIQDNQEVLYVSLIKNYSYVFSKLEPLLGTSFISWVVLVCISIYSILTIFAKVNKDYPYFDLRCLYFGGFILFVSLFFPKLQEGAFILIICLSFLFSYLVLLFKNNQIISSISYLLSIVILVFKPALLLPFVGKFFDESLKIDYPVMNSLGVVYCILMFLMLFSLQKTARKNSIIPS